jgi:hypothetical protein
MTVMMQTLYWHCGISWAATELWHVHSGEKLVMLSAEAFLPTLLSHTR